MGKHEYSLAYAFEEGAMSVCINFDLFRPYIYVILYIIVYDIV